MQFTEYLIETSDRCIRIASHGRRLAEELDAAVGPESKEPYLRLSVAGLQLANELESLGHELLAKAVELDTERDKDSSRTNA